MDLYIRHIETVIGALRLLGRPLDTIQIEANRITKMCGELVMEVLNFLVARGCARIVGFTVDHTPRKYAITRAGAELRRALTPNTR